MLEIQIDFQFCEIPGYKRSCFLAKHERLCDWLNETLSKILEPKETTLYECTDFTEVLRKFKKLFKKCLTQKRSGVMISELLREHSMNLENDTETETQERQQVPESIQDWTEEFDPGSGRTLAECLTHASRAETRERKASAGRSHVLAADGWVTREQSVLHRGIRYRKVF